MAFPGGSNAAPPSITSIEDAYKPAFQEIARRAGVARTGACREETSHFERSADAARTPFLLPEQDYILLSLGTAVLAPRPLDVSRPCVRVYGAFGSYDDALAHADVVRGVDAACSLVVAPRNEWLLLPQTEAARDDPEERARRLEKRLAAHYAARSASDAEFERVVREHAERPAPQEVPVEDEDARETREAEGIVYPPPRRLRAGAEVRGQNAVALCVVPDSVGGECLLKVLGCFETAAEADAWARNVASRRVTEDDIVVAPACEWCYPNAAHARSGSDHYRSDELQRIMDAAARNPQAVRDYKEWKREQDERKALEEEEEQARTALLEGAEEGDAMAIEEVVQ